MPLITVLVAESRRHRSRIQQNFRFRDSKREVWGIHGLLFYDLDGKKFYLPTRKDAMVANPDDSKFIWV